MRQARADGWSVAAIARQFRLPRTTVRDVSPTRLSTDRMDYRQVAAEPRKRQTLLNVVRLRYADRPEFLDVHSIVIRYTFGGGAAASGVLRGAEMQGLLVLDRRWRCRKQEYLHLPDDSVLARRDRPEHCGAGRDGAVTMIRSVAGVRVAAADSCRCQRHLA